MNETLDQRVLGAIRWVDAVTLAPISLPLTVRGPGLHVRRNRTGLTILTHVAGLEAHTRTFDLATLPPADAVPVGDLDVTGEVEDPTETYLPRRFTLALPRDPSPALLAPNGQRPPASLFTPLDLALLPAPAARLPPGCAEVRVQILDANGRGLRHALARVVATADGAVLGCGLADARGETLVAIPGLKHFAPGATADAVVTLETEARLEIIPPPPNATAVDWTVLRDAPVPAGHTDPQLLRLRPGAQISRRFLSPA